MACHKLGLSVDEFWYYVSPIELYYMFKSYNEEKQNDQIFELNKMRLQTLYLINIQLKPNNQIRDPKKLMKFDWENIADEIIEIPNKDDWEKIDNLLK